jgi:hypothetical protein
LDGFYRNQVGSGSGELIGTVEIPNTGGWQTWETASADIESVTGTYDVYLVFVTSNTYACNINWLQLCSSTTTTTTVNQIELEEVSVYPNPMTDYLTIVNAIDSDVEIYSIDGDLMSSRTIESNRQSIYIGQLDYGNYLVKVTTSNGSAKTFKVIKK